MSAVDKHPAKMFPGASVRSGHHVVVIKKKIGLRRNTEPISERE